MNDKQLNFLDDLQRLFENYNISEMFAEDKGSAENTPIQFWSNGKYVQVSCFCLGKFHDCNVYYGDHSRKDAERHD